MPSRQRFSSRTSSRKKDGGEGKAFSDDAVEFKEDASGHEHAGKGKGGGQFVKAGGGGSGEGDAKEGKKPAKAEKPKGEAPEKETTATADAKMAEQAKGVVGTIRPAKDRAFTGKPAGSKIDSRLAGAIGEEILIQHLKGLGKEYKDAQQTSEWFGDSHNNLAMDLIADHRLVEAKTGQAFKPDGVWALKYDGKFTKAEEAKFAKMTPDEVKAEKKKINAAKVRAIHARKAAFEGRVNAELKKRAGKGKKAPAVKVGMMTVIVNPDTKTADIYEFDGIHDRIPFQSEMADKGYVRTVRYG